MNRQENGEKLLYYCAHGTKMGLLKRKTGDKTEKNPNNYQFKSEN